jgi:transcriptional regulator with XRE-family HTH domain
MSQLFDQIAQETPEHVRIFVDLSFEVADRIQALLLAKNMQQKDLAKALGKQESEVSKWLTGTHNFTLKTLSKIQAILEDEVIMVVPGFHWHGEILASDNFTDFDLQGVEQQFKDPVISPEPAGITEESNQGESDMQPYVLAA